MNQEQLMQVILAPDTSEKTTRLAEDHNQITFKVLRTATKSQIKRAVETMFKVKVGDVRVSNSKGKQRRIAQNKYDCKKKKVCIARSYCRPDAADIVPHDPEQKPQQTETHRNTRKYRNFILHCR